MLRCEVRQVKLRKGDIIIALVLVLAAGFWLLTNYISNHTAVDNVVIEINGGTYRKIPVNQLKEQQLIHVELENNKYIDILADKSGVSIKDVVCPDKLCQKTGVISKVGQSIVCLPNKVVIYYEGEQNSEVDNVAY